MSVAKSGFPTCLGSVPDFWGPYLMDPEENWSEVGREKNVWRASQAL